MKARLKLCGGKLEVEMDAGSEKELFKQIAKTQEVFDAENKCGCCGKTDLRFVVRNVDDNDFYELHCTNRVCRAKFAFGQHKKGVTLFPKRRGDDDKWLDNGGWFKYEGKKKEK